MKTRLFSLLSGTPAVAKVKHYLGAPPQLTGGKDLRKEMGPPAFLVIEERPDGIFLYRFGYGRMRRRYLAHEYRRCEASGVI